MASTFRNSLDFFYQIGIYDVILPFLLIFTIVFAVLEKSKIFGTVQLEGNDITRKNLNAMIAFVTAFFVVGSTQLVAAISQAVANVVLLLVMTIFFLMLAGSFQKEGPYFLEGGWNTAFMWISFIGVLLIFLHALGWLDYLYGFAAGAAGSVVMPSLILLAIVLGLMRYVTKDPGGKK